MTRIEAQRKAYTLWGSESNRGLAIQRRKNVTDRCEVGYAERGAQYIKGRGPTWESAFADAAKRTQPAVSP